MPAWREGLGHGQPLRLGEGVAVDARQGKDVAPAASAASASSTAQSAISAS
jgi:hypothetical protein